MYKFTEAGNKSKRKFFLKKKLFLNCTFSLKIFPKPMNFYEIFFEFGHDNEFFLKKKLSEADLGLLQHPKWSAMR